MRRVQAAPHVGTQFRQLPMFMSAHEIRSQYQPGIDERMDVMEEHEDRLESDDELWDRKYEESQLDWGDGRGRQVDHILKNGVEEPIHLEAPARHNRGRQPSILDGHHRISVMYEHRPHDYMPVEHH